MDLLNFSTSKQNPLVQSQCVTGHQLLSVQTLAALPVDSADCLRSLFTMNESCYATYILGLGLIFQKTFSDSLDTNLVQSEKKTFLVYRNE